MIFRLETPRLILRPFLDLDLDAFLGYRNDPEVARYQGWLVPYSREKGIEFIDFMRSATPNLQGEWYQAAIELKSTGEMIGDVAFLVKRDDARQAYLGYTLARSYWRNGYTREAVLRLLVYLFDELRFHRVIAECDVENIASWKLLERLGFRREAHLIENIFFKGKYGSEYNYALLEREWGGGMPER